MSKHRQPFFVCFWHYVVWGRETLYNINRNLEHTDRCSILFSENPSKLLISFWKMRLLWTAWKRVTQVQNHYTCQNKKNHWFCSAMFSAPMIHSPTEPTSNVRKQIFYSIIHYLTRNVHKHLANTFFISSFFTFGSNSLCNRDFQLTLN